MDVETSECVSTRFILYVDTFNAPSKYDDQAKYVYEKIVTVESKEIVKDDELNGYPISADLQESTSFIHGNSLIVVVDRHGYEEAVDNEVLRLPYSSLSLFYFSLSLIYSAEQISIGSFILINDGSSLCGLLQATSMAKCYVGKMVRDTTLAIEVSVRVWYRFHSLSYRRVPIPIDSSTQCWIGKNTMTAIMGEFLRDSGPIDYPVSIVP